MSHIPYVIYVDSQNGTYFWRKEVAQLYHIPCLRLKTTVTDWSRTKGRNRENQLQIWEARKISSQTSQYPVIFLLSSFKPKGLQRAALRIWAIIASERLNKRGDGAVLWQQNVTGVKFGAGGDRLKKQKEFHSECRIGVRRRGRRDQFGSVCKRNCLKNLRASLKNHMKPHKESLSSSVSSPPVQPHGHSVG